MSQNRDRPLRGQGQEFGKDTGPTGARLATGAAECAGVNRAPGSGVMPSGQGGEWRKWKPQV